MILLYCKCYFLNALRRNRNQLKHYSSHLFVELFFDQMDLKNKILLLFVQTYRKQRRIHMWTYHLSRTKVGKNLLMWKFHGTRTRKDAYIGKSLAPKSFFHFHSQKKSVRPAASLLSRSLVACNSTAS